MKPLSLECQELRYSSPRKEVSAAIHDPFPLSLATCTFLPTTVVPPSPTNITTQRLNGTHMNISWRPIPLTESRGFIQSYTITYQRVSQTVKRQVLSISVLGSESSVVIGGLDPASAYSVSVGATTSAGPGISSLPSVTPGAHKVTLPYLNDTMSISCRQLSQQYHSSCEG